MSTTPETHQGKQRMNFLLMIYGLIVLGITMYIAFADIWPITFFQDLLLDSQNMYPMKAVFVLTLFSVGVVLFPLYWVAKKMMEKKNQTEAINAPYVHTAASGSNSGPKEFSFTYSLAVSTITIDNLNIQVKMGFVTRNFAPNALKYFYLVSKKQYQTLYMIYTDQSGKQKSCPMNANAGEAQMAELVAELTARFPERGLNHLKAKEAFKTMGVMNPTTIAIYILLVIFGGIGVAIYFAVSGG